MKDRILGTLFALPFLGVGAWMLWSISSTIFDARIRWELLGFKSIFLFVFGGIGLGMLIFIWRAPKDKDPTLAKYQDSPWLLNHAWQTPSIRSGSKATMWSAWAFAGIWNLISAVTPFMAWKEVTENENYLALVALLFPLIGLGLLVWAARRTLEWRRFGPAPVTLDPFPGSIGGHVGGTVDLDLPWDSNARFQLTLTNLRSYISGSGKNRKRTEKAEWQDEIVAHAEPGGKGTRLTFRFDVPEGLDPSDAQQDNDDYHLWRLNLRADIPGADLDRDYEIPVYATATQSRHLSQHAVERGRRAQAELSDASVRDVIQWKQGVTGRSMFYPAGRNLWSNLAGFVVGAVFAGAGYFLIVQEGAKAFGGVFGGVGALVALSAFYMATNSLEVWQDGTRIRTLRRWLGIPVSRKEMSRSAFTRLRKKKSMRTQSGGKHVIFYSIQALDAQGNKLVVGIGFRGASRAEAAMRLIAAELGLRHQPEPGPGPADFDSDVLTADF